MFEKYATTCAATVREMEKVLLGREKWKPFPKFGDRAAWDAVDDAYRALYLEPTRREAILTYRAEPMRATEYMRFFRSGGESGDTTTTHSHRQTLMNAVIAECLEGKGAFIDQIIDLIWTICEESTWVAPTHNNHMHNHMWSGVIKNALPDVENINFIDLRAGFTAATLGWTYYFLKERLDEESPLICRRIEYEIERRIVTPFMTHDDLTWFGYYGHKINNWNPWILENIIPACLFTMRDTEKRTLFMARALEKFDIYVHYLTPDGACDEGPAYWEVAGASFMNVLDITRDSTGGAVDMTGTNLAIRVCEYIADACMCDSGNLFANFADAGMEHRYSSILGYYARVTGSTYLSDFAASRDDAACPPGIDAHRPWRGLRMMFIAPEKPPEAAHAPFVHRDAWYPDGQLLFVRSSDDRVALSAKGGYNNESHNHNDAGSFIYMVDGQPAICDLGGLNYTARAFSPYRYEFWIVNSTAHNCATIGGFAQHNGDEYRTRVLTESNDGKHIALSLDLVGTYEATAGIRQHDRSFLFDKETGGLVLTDVIETAAPTDADVHFLTSYPVEVSADGRTVGILLPSGGRVTLACPGATLSLEYHYRVRFEKEHFTAPGPEEDGVKCEATRIVFAFPDPKTARTIKTEIARLPFVTE